MVCLCLKVSIHADRVETEWQSCVGERWLWTIALFVLCVSYKGVHDMLTQLRYEEQTWQLVLTLYRDRLDSQVHSGISDVVMDDASVGLSDTLGCQSFLSYLSFIITSLRCKNYQLRMLCLTVPLSSIHRVCSTWTVNWSGMLRVVLGNKWCTRQVEHSRI